MNQHWRNHYNENAKSHSLLKQVEKTVMGNEIGQDQFEMIVRTILNNLNITKKDCFLDLCCGNGLITNLIAEKAGNSVGIDFSENMISVATTSKHISEVDYVVQDITALDQQFISKFNKFNIYEGIQYLNENVFIDLLSKINLSRDSFTFFIGGIPDVEKLSNFYDTEEKMAFYKERESIGKPHLGRWWHKHELQDIANNCNLHIRFIDQHKSLYTSYYRFDCLIWK